MSFQSTAYSTPNFQIIPAQRPRNLVAPWGVVNHLPSSINVGDLTVILTPEQTVSGTFLVAPTTGTVQYQFPDSSSWYRFLSTKSVPGYENLSEGDVFVFNVINNGAGDAEFIPGTGALGVDHLVAAGVGGASYVSVPVLWTVTSTGSSYTVL
jgi:hypothetical protein